LLDIERRCIRLAAVGTPEVSGNTRQIIHD
jgi:hypothetical protein